MPTGKGAHGLYVSRDSKVLYVSNRGEGSVSVIDFASRKEAAKWRLPGGGSPDMGGVSADGKVLWLAGRYNSEVYAIDTSDGQLLARIKVGRDRTASVFTRSQGVIRWGIRESSANVFAVRRADLRSQVSKSTYGFPLRCIGIAMSRRSLAMPDCRH